MKITDLSLEKQDPTLTEVGGEVCQRVASPSIEGLLQQVIDELKQVNEILSDLK